MKKALLGFGLGLVLVSSAFAQDKEQDRVENAGTVMKEILNAPDGIPQSVLDKADCVVILPSVVKFAIGIGGSYGRGLMTCRRGSTFHGKWGPPTMMALEGGSVGLQLGGNATDFILLMMSPRSAKSVLSSKVKLGADASAAAGPVGRAASAETDVAMKAQILSYSRARGVFGGVSLQGSTMRSDDGANKNLYGKELGVKEIVRGGVVQVPEAGKPFLAILQETSPKHSS